MANNPTHPLTVRGTDLNITIDVLGVGGRVRKSSGEDVDPSEVGEEDCILDLRGLESDAKPCLTLETESRTEQDWIYPEMLFQ